MDPKRIQGKVVGVACKATSSSLPWGNAKASVLTDGPVMCDAGRNGGQKMGMAYKTVSCCPEKTQVERDCWKAYGATKTAGAGH
jgi:hypothetical protein